MVCKYYLVIGGIKTEVRKTDLVNWDKIEYSLSREKFGGITRSTSSSFKFFGDSAERITEEFLEHGLYAKGDIEVYVLGEFWTHLPSFVAHLDFTTYGCENGVVSIKSIDNSLAAIIKANKGKKYEFLMTEFSDSTGRPFLYEGVNLQNFTSFELGEWKGDMQPREFSTLNGQANQKIIVVVDKEDVLQSQGVIASSQSGEAFDIMTEEQMRKMYDVVYEPSYTFPYGANTNGANKLLQNSSNNCVPVNVDIDFTLQLPEFAKYEEVEFYLSTAIGFPENHEGNIYHRYGYGEVQFARIPNNGNRYSLKRGFDLYPGYSLMLLMKVRNVSPMKVKVLSNKINMVWSAGKSPKGYIDYVTPLSLLKRLVEAMSKDRRYVEDKPYECAIEMRTSHVDPKGFKGLGSSVFDSRLSETILVPKDAVHHNPDSVCYIKTSFDEFCKWIETVYGFVSVIEGNKITFKHRDQVFSAKAGKYVDRVNDITYRVNNNMMYATVEIGYKDNDDDYNMQNYEFNKTLVYDTGIVNVEKKLSMISPYRADSVGFEKEYEEGFEKKESEKDSGDGVWCVHVADATEDGVPVKKVVKAQLGIGISYDYNGMFNHYLSPIYCLKANSRFISSFVDKLILVTSYVNDVKLKSDVDSEMLSIKRDFIKTEDDCMFYSSPLFSIGLVSFKTSDTEPPKELAKPIVLEWMDKRVIGYVNDFTNKIGRDEVSEYTVIVKKIEAL